MKKNKRNRNFKKYTGDNLRNFYKHELYELKVQDENRECDSIIVLQEANMIINIEVKAGKSGTLKSLLQFVLQKKVPLAVRFDMNQPSIQNIEHKVRQADATETVKFTLISLPLYMAGQLGRLLDWYRS